MSKLRFKGHAEPWEQRKLGDLIELGGSGGTPTSSNKDYYGGEYPFLSISDITKQGKYVTKTKSSLTQAGIDNSGAWLIPTGSLIYAMYASVGKLCINNYPVTTSQALYAMQLKDEVNTSYIYSALERVNVEQLNRVITQGTQKNINAKTLKNFNIPLPSLREQEKIGGFLSALDERLRIQSDLVDLLVLEYTGYSQRIFSQTLRFKDQNGKNYPDWEQKKLGDLIELGGSGGTPTSSNKDYYGGEYPFLSISDITKQGKYVTETKSSLTKAGIDNSGAWVVPTGSLIYAMYASVGKLCINNYPVTTSQALYAMKLKSEVDINYIYSALERVNIEQLNRVITQGTQKNINAKTLKNFDIALPSLPEQEKIGGFLSALSARIEAERALLDQYKEQKKAYLQKLLP